MNDRRCGRTAVLLLVLLFSLACGLLPQTSRAPIITAVPASPVPTSASISASPQAPEETTTTEATAEQMPSGPTIVVDANPDNDLLFCASQQGSSRACYHGSVADASMRLTYVSLEGSDAEARIVVLDESLVPVQWILPEATVAAYRPAGGVFDPRQGTYVVYRGEEMAALTADVYPGELAALIERLESSAGRRFEAARALLDEYEVQTFDELVELARAGGADQPRLLAAAVGFSTAAAVRSLEEAAGQGVAPGARVHLAALPAPGLPEWLIELLGEIAEQLLEYAGSELADYLLDLLMPHLPGMLLCRGRTLIPKVCAYVFFPKSRLMDCIAQCQTTMDCFTDICMPLGGGMTDELAGKFIDYLAGR